ncbi:permease [Roseomonas sp. HJA6]|uniref:Permease n=1 Tax=Roseomonas alba TaxID=2846776 RepID=A0ABS7ABE3_9PROT|nr:permease [Neoroseomonas alba]MBW6399631.1 permease [Neoroseomonas alba]
MTPGQAFLWVLAIIALGFCFRKGPAAAHRAGVDAAKNLLKILPLFAVALPMAAFLAELIPADAAVAWIGPDSGFKGIAIGSVAGGLMPGGPFVTFPLVLAFAKAGAGVPQMVALVSGWCIFALHRIITWEYPVLGWRFVALRMISGLPLPIAAGLISELVVEVLPISLGVR